MISTCKLGVIGTAPGQRVMSSKVPTLSSGCVTDAPLEKPRMRNQRSFVLVIAKFFSVSSLSLPEQARLNHPPDSWIAACVFDCGCQLNLLEQFGWHIVSKKIFLKPEEITFPYTVSRSI